MAIEAQRASLGERLRLVLQLALAALLASASGGLLLVPLFAVAAGVTAALESGSPEMGAAAAPPIVFLLVMLSGLAIVPAVAVCWLPAFVAGAILRMAERKHGWARGRRVWAAAGVTVAGFAWLQAFPPGAVQPHFDESSLAMPTFAAAFLLAGAAAGLVFRSAMGTLAPFFGFDEDEETP